MGRPTNAQDVSVAAGRAHGTRHAATIAIAWPSVTLLAPRDSKHVKSAEQEPVDNRVHEPDTVTQTQQRHRNPFSLPPRNTHTPRQRPPQPAAPPTDCPTPEHLLTSALTRSPKTHRTMPFWTLFWLIAPAVALLVIGTWISLGSDESDR